MLGAIIGDIVGSRFEWHNIKTKDFELFTDDCFFTDDSVMSIAVAKSILDCQGNFDNLNAVAVQNMQALGRKYPDAGYGGHFIEWLFDDHPEPYDSYGNGSAMRVSACGFAGKNLKEVKLLSRKVTEVSHNHVEGLKGAEATAVAIFMARNGADKHDIFEYISDNYYELNFTLDEIRPEYEFDVTCQDSVPQAIVAFLESTSFEDAIRNAISIGGDSDTIAAITGGIAEAYYNIPTRIKLQALDYLDDEMINVLTNFEKTYHTL